MHPASSLNLGDPLEQIARYGMKTYRRLEEVFVRGEGCWLYTESGKQILDLVAGVATNQLGHCHPELVAEISRQAGQLIHVQGSCVTRPQAALAESLCELSSMDRVFFTPCGTTAVETAIKIAKKYGRDRDPSTIPEIICMQGSFHGRTLGSLSATMQGKFQDPFLPLLPGFVAVPSNDLGALRSAFTDRTIAVMLEPIQGESGVHPLRTEYLREVRNLTQASGALMISDEIQTGMGRTGTFFNFEQHGFQPDVLVLAKGLGSGVPIGACVAKGEAAEVLGIGDHGSTSGGNPLACAVAQKVIAVIQRDDILENVKQRSDQFRQECEKMPNVDHVRGSGLMLGVALKQPNARDVAERALAIGLMINAANDSTIRLVPPLNICENLVDFAVSKLADVLSAKS